MMTLYYADVLSARWACAAAKHLNAPVDYVCLDLAKGDQKKPAYLAINPNGKVPTLVSGDRVTWEADAVVCQLSDDMRADFWPHDARQIEVVRWFSWNTQHFTRAGGALFFENIIKARFGIGKPDARVVDEAQTEFRRYAAILSSHLAKRTWLVADTLSAADFAVAMALPFAEAAQIPLDDFPVVRRWHDRLMQFDGWRDPYPAR
jgi:glutathione S-transferase